MSAELTRGLQEVADDVARAHTAGPGLPLDRIDTRARRARRRHEVTVVVASGAAVAALVLGGAALLDRPGAVPPAVTPTTPPAPSTSPTADVSTPEVTPTPALSPTPGTSTPGVTWGAADLDGLVLDPAALAAALPALEDLVPVEVPMGEWAMDPEFEVFPTEDCRAAITVVVTPPVAFQRVGWTSDAALVNQELVVLADGAAAAEAFAALGAAHEGCPEYGGSVPWTSGASYVAADVAADDEGLPSYRVAGTESGEGNENAWLVVDVLVDNVIVRTEVFRYDGPTAATADEAAAVGDAVVQALEAARAARQS